MEWEFRRYLACGLLAYSFARARCRTQAPALVPGALVQGARCRSPYLPARDRDQAVRQRCCTFDRALLDSAFKLVPYCQSWPAAYRVKMFCMPIGPNLLSQWRIFRLQQHHCRTACFGPLFVLVGLGKAGALPVGHATRTPVRVPATGLPERRCRQAHRCLHHTSHSVARVLNQGSGPAERPALSGTTGFAVFYRSGRLL